MAKKLFETTIPIKPQGKARPKIVARKAKGGKVFSQAITPDQTVNAEQAIRSHVSPQWGMAPLADALAVRLTAYVLRPASKPKKYLYPTSKPDTDNILKLVCDSLNGILWSDDAVIADGACRKRFCTPAFPQECLHLVVYQLGEEDL